MTTEANELAELRIVLGSLLNLLDPPSVAARRRYAQDEDGYWMSIDGFIRVGRELIPKPALCLECTGDGCDACDGAGYDARTPITASERRIWASFGIDHQRLFPDKP